MFPIVLSYHSSICSKTIKGCSTTNEVKNFSIYFYDHKASDGINLQLYIETMPWCCFMRLNKSCHNRIFQQLGSFCSKKIENVFPNGFQLIFLVGANGEIIPHF